MCISVCWCRCVLSLLAACDHFVHNAAWGRGAKRNSVSVRSGPKDRVAHCNRQQPPAAFVLPTAQNHKKHTEHCNKHKFARLHNHHPMANLAASNASKFSALTTGNARSLTSLLRTLTQRVQVRLLVHPCAVEQLGGHVVGLRQGGATTFGLRSRRSAKNQPAACAGIAGPLLRYKPVIDLETPSCGAVKLAVELLYARAPAGYRYNSIGTGPFFPLRTMPPFLTARPWVA